MATIRKRTVLVEVDKKGVYNVTDAMTDHVEYHKFWDWALVQTSLGSMAEPFQVGMKYPICTGQSVAGYNPEDEMTRIDEIKFMDYNPILLSGGDPSINPNALIGGIMMTRAGK